MDLNAIQRVGVRFEARNQNTRSNAAKSLAGGEQFLDLELGSSNNSFNLVGTLCTGARHVIRLSLDPYALSQMTSYWNR